MTDRAGPVGVLPAAGMARRLGRIPCSKEILPVGLDDGGLRPAIAAALRGFRTAGIDEAWICISPGKGDIREFLGEEYHGVHLRYHVVENSRGAPESIQFLGDRLEGRTVALAFPDIQFQPPDAIARALARLQSTDDDISLCLVPSDRGDKVDLVEAGPDNMIRSLAMKPGPGHGGWTWIAAAWRPSFTRLLRAFRVDSGLGREVYFGDVILAGLRHGLRGGTVRCPEGWSLDIGTPQDLARLWSRAGVNGRGSKES